MEKNLTTESVSKTIVYFALPYLLSYFLQTLYGMADLFITGQFCGVDSITAVSNGSQVMHMLTVIIVGLAMGTTVVIGRAIGADNKENAGVAIGNTITLFMGLSIVLTVVLLALVKPIVSLIAIPDEAVSGTVAYLIICFIGIPFITAYNIISSIFRGMGDSKSPMYFIAVACAANIALDYLFIGACSLGPIGAALGTTLAAGALLAAGVLLTTGAFVTADSSAFLTVTFAVNVLEVFLPFLGTYVTLAETVVLPSFRPVTFPLETLAIFLSFTDHFTLLIFLTFFF